MTEAEVDIMKAWIKADNSGERKNMSFVIPAGTTAALAGKSGSQTCHQNTGKEI